jgi:predicted Na+-dependent transporter
VSNCFGFGDADILKNKINMYIEIMPLVSVVAIVLIVAAIIAASKTALLQSGLLVLLIVALHNGLGFYWVFGQAVFWDCLILTVKRWQLRWACKTQG